MKKKLNINGRRDKLTARERAYTIILPANLKLVCITMLSFFMLLQLSTYAQDSLMRIGVLALRGAEESVQRWTPTAEYLSKQIPEYTFVIVPLDFEQIFEAVKNGEVDFALENSSIYVELEYLYGIDRIATMNFSCKSKNLVLNQFGGVFFTSKVQKDIKNLDDLRHKSFMAVHETSFGGWRMAQRELKDKRIDPYRYFKELQFGGTHDAVVYAVQKGEVDAGTVRTSILEKMDMEGKIDINDFTILNQQYLDNFPLLLSTRLYPEWPFARVKHTSDQLTKKVAITLLSMPPNSEAARVAGIAGWTIPNNYQPVHDCLKELRVSPYEELGEITLANLMQQYWEWILLGFIGIIILVAVVIYISRLNRKLNISTIELKERTTQLSESNKELKEFAYIVSHDLKAPLRAISQLSHWISTDYQDAFDDEGKEMLALLGRRVKRMDLLIDGILQYSRVGRVENEETLDLNSLVKDIITNLAAPENIEIKVLNTLPKHIGDPTRFTQVFQNLISNSINFIDKPKGKINIACSDEGKYWKFLVEDNGPGIEEKYFDKAFQIFQTLQPRDKQEGTGVGLSLVKKIINFYKGNVWIESNVGEGTTVFFTLPKIKKGTNHEK